MPDIVRTMHYTMDMDAPLVTRPLVGTLQCTDKLADTVQLAITQGGAEVSLDGASAVGLFRRPVDGTLVRCPGTVSGGVITVPLLDQCYMYAGEFDLLIKLTGGGVERTVLRISGYVEAGGDGVIVDPTGSIPSYDDLAEAIASANSAASAANAAADNANAKATAADTAATAANTAASSANAKATAADTAASAANTAAAKIEGLTVEATGLDADAPPTAAVSEVDGHKHIAFGIPKGDKGDTGTTPALTVGSVTTGSPGTEASATITGTAEEPVLNLIIPRGDSGSGSVSTVDGVQPDGGDVPLGAVRYNTAQSLSESQQAQARQNIGAGKADEMVKTVDGETPYAEGDVHINAVRYTAQTLTEAQQEQARGNIGALGGDDVVDSLTSDDGDKPLSAKQGKALKAMIDVIPVADGAGAHNAIYRGASLGTSVSDAQWAAIADGTFAGLYIGDYWTIDSIVYRIAAFDYYYNTGDTACTTHHAVLVPDVRMYTHTMNDTNDVTGAYVGSKMYTEGLDAAKTTINNAFGSDHILNHRQYLQNAVTDGYASAGSWYDSTVELMTEQNVYGCKIFGNCINGTAEPNNYTVDKSQYPLFRYGPDMISNRQWYWLRDVASATNFGYVHDSGRAFSSRASSPSGVRPAFCIC